MTTTVIQETKVLWDTTADKLYVWDSVSKAWELFFVAADLVTNDALTDALALKLDKVGGTIGGSLAIGNALTVSGSGTFGGAVVTPQLTLNSAALTISSGNLYVATSKVWTEGNDGSGSGLDADTLDGHDSGYFTDIVSRLGYTPFNAAGGTITGNTVIGGTITGASTLTLNGLALSVASGNFYVAGTGKVWTSDNDGSGSGLDADTLDGHDTGYFTDVPSRLGYTPFNAAGGAIGGNTSIAGTLSVTGDVTLSGTIGAKFEATTNYDNYIAAGAWTKIAFNTASHNDQGAFSASTGRFTAPAAGYYLIGLKWRFQANSTVPESVQTRFHKNGSALAATAAESWGTVATLKTHLAIQTVMKLAANDYIEAYAYMETYDGYVDSDESVFYGARIA